MKKKYIFLILIFCSFFVFSCKQQIKITGEWENNDRVLKFDEYGNFQIKYKNPTKIKSFSGITAIKKNILVLIFEEYETTDGIQGFTDTTDLAGYKEVLQISITDKVLYTKILASGKEYKYLKIK